MAVENYPAQFQPQKYPHPNFPIAMPCHSYGGHILLGENYVAHIARLKYIQQLRPSIKNGTLKSPVLATA